MTQITSLTRLRNENYYFPSKTFFNGKRIKNGKMMQMYELVNMPCIWLNLKIQFKLEISSVVSVEKEGADEKYLQSRSGQV